VKCFSQSKQELTGNNDELPALPHRYLHRQTTSLLGSGSPLTTRCATR